MCPSAEKGMCPSREGSGRTHLWYKELEVRGTTRRFLDKYMDQSYGCKETSRDQTEAVGCESKVWSVK